MQHTGLDDFPLGTAGSNLSGHDLPLRRSRTPAEYRVVYSGAGEPQDHTVAGAGAT